MSLEKIFYKDIDQLREGLREAYHSYKKVREVLDKRIDQINKAWAEGTATEDHRALGNTVDVVYDLLNGYVTGDLVTEEDFAMFAERRQLPEHYIVDWIEYFFLGTTMDGTPLPRKKIIKKKIKTDSEPQPQPTEG